LQWRASSCNDRLCLTLISARPPHHKAPCFVPSRGWRIRMTDVSAGSRSRTAIIRRRRDGPISSTGRGSAHRIRQGRAEIPAPRYRRRVSAVDPGCVKTRTTGRQSINFSRFSAPFRHYRLGGAKKPAPEAPFSDNFRVFIQSRPFADLRLRVMKRRLHESVL
jgi:hypothetical protein